MQARTYRPDKVETIRKLNKARAKGLADKRAADEQAARDRAQDRDTQKAVAIATPSRAARSATCRRCRSSTGIEGPAREAAHGDVVERSEFFDDPPEL